MRVIFKDDKVFKKIEKKMVFVPEDDRYDDDFKHPTQYYIVAADGTGIYFKTRCRGQAQTWADDLFGRNFYQVRKAIKAVAH